MKSHCTLYRLREAAFFSTDNKESMWCLLHTAVSSTDQPDSCLLEVKTWTIAACMHASTEYKERG